MTAGPSRRWWMAVLGAGLAAGLAAGAPAEDDVILIDGMSVDILRPAEDERPPFEGRIPSLAGSAAEAPRLPLVMADPPRTPEQEQRALAFFRRAEALAREGDYRHALVELRDGLVLDPSNPALLSRAALHAVTLREYERAAGYFRRLIELGHDNPANLVGYAGVLLRLARLDEAERLLAETEPAMPDNLALRFNRLVLELVRERRDASPAYWTRRTLDQVGILVSWLTDDRERIEGLMGAEDFALLCDLTLGPGTVRHLPAIAGHIETLREGPATENTAAKESALDALETLGLHTLGIEAHRAELERATGRGDAALGRWRALLDRAPDWSHARLQYAFSLLRADQPEEAVTVMRALPGLDREPLARFVLASALSLSGDREAAGDIYNELVLDHPQALRQWLGLDPVFDRAIRRMRNYANLMRMLGLPPELD